jgi:DNA-binding SARP family transcriptional activator
MEFGILGSLEVRRNGRPVALGGPKPKAVVAMLLLHANDPVGAERLACGIWGDDVAPAAIRTLQAYIARLRKALGEDEVLTRTPDRLPDAD